MRRREFIAGIGSAAGWPLVARAQQAKTPVVWWLEVVPIERAPEVVEGFRRGLAEVGFSEGRDVTVEYRVVDPGHGETLPAVIADLVRRRAAAIITFNGFVASALKGATREIPVVFNLGYDPVELGLVASLNRPGGNLTGVITPTNEIAEKRVQLLHEAVPAVETIAFLVGSTIAPFNQIETRHMQSAARTLGLRFLVFNVTTDSEIAPVFATLVEHQVGAIVVGGSLDVILRSDEILSHAARFALPTMFVYSYFARAGGLLSYGADLSDNWRQMGAYTGRILKGEKPGDLPVIQSTKFELVINMKTAKALGLTIPPNLLAVADEVIE
jgi:putative tryptophan/tyrosine transport system substrate-binding protein